jgi:prevent-host-death family protein
METAAISKLKASLSEYLSKVKAGEKVLVTERGKPIAKIIPQYRCVQTSTGFLGSAKTQRQ